MTERLRVALEEGASQSGAFAAEFGEFLVSLGILDATAIGRAQRAAEAAGDRFDLVLAKLGLIVEADLAAAIARFLGLPLYTPGDELVQPLLADKLPPSFVMHNRVLPVRLEGDTLTLAVVDPLDRMPLDSIRFVVDFAIRHEVISLADFERVVAVLYHGESASMREPASTSEDPSEHDLQRLRDSASEAPVIRLVSQIISAAVDARASDIYIEPTAQALSVRYRIDGMLRTAEDVPARLRAAVISRVKILAKLDIAERRLPQDGRIKLAIRGNDIDFRVATIPTIDGETITMRVLDRSRIKLDFPSLGFEADQIAALHRVMEQPNGIILLTGPTGSGKTTTLYTMLKHVNRPTVKIFTVEDPIEYQLAGISQVQVQQSINLDFPTCLRAILRHHPNMIMIGEIRDIETARIAVQASLTGHLVFSTLHTNSAAETVTRLIDMGIEHFLLGSTLRGIMAQRLVRRLCLSCAQPHQAAREMASELADAVPVLRRWGTAKLLEPRGCEKCGFSGFRGQLPIAELMIVDEAARRAILQRLPAAEIERMARRGGGGGGSMYEDGVAKAWQGLTTVEEVLRVVTADDAERP